MGEQADRAADRAAGQSLPVVLDSEHIDWMVVPWEVVDYMEMVRVESEQGRVDQIAARLQI